MTFHEAVAWIEEHLGQQVCVSISAQPESRTSSGAVVSGRLRPANGEWSVIDPRGGERKAFDVGNTGGFLLIEGDFIEAHTFDDALSMHLHDLQINVTIT